MKKHLLKSETYEIIPGKTSGLKILAYIGKKVNKRSSGRWLHISSKLTERKPLQHISELEGELAEINVLIDQVTHQGHDFSSKEMSGQLSKVATWLKWAVLHLGGSMGSKPGLRKSQQTKVRSGTQNTESSALTDQNTENSDLGGKPFATRPTFKSDNLVQMDLSLIHI